MTPAPPDKELRHLTDKWLDQGELTRTEMARLEELLENDANLAYYLDVTQQEALLPIALAEAPHPEARKPRLFRVMAPLLMAAAACVTFFLGMFAGRRQPPPPDSTALQVPAPAAARITGMMGVQWSGGDHPDLIHSSGASERISIRTGLVEITYSSGVRVTLEGPADYDITDPESGRLTRGKLVAAVPKGAEGFRVNYHDGEVVDLGTEFAMDVKPGGPAEVGVFDGEIELRRDGLKPVSLYENHAVIHDKSVTEDPLQAIPLDREKYVRRLPSREFAWEIDSDTPRELEFDVTHLLWKPSEYRAVFKWINGHDGAMISDVELRLDGQRVAADHHTGQTGPLERVQGNLFRLNVDPKAYRTGRWTFHARLTTLPRNPEFEGPVHSSGILQFEEGLVSSATAGDFIGKWSYRYLGEHFIREFHADGRVTLKKEGELDPIAFENSRWTVSDGILSVFIPRLQAVEDHVLRDRDTLIFMGRPFENAARAER